MKFTLTIVFVNVILVVSSIDLCVYMMISEGRVIVENLSVLSSKCKFRMHSNLILLDC